MRPSWNDYFMVLAKIISTRSTCTSRPTGAVIVRDSNILATGYNGSMPGAPHCLGTQTENGTPFCFRRSVNAPEVDKYNYCRASHAEANAVAQAARMGINLDGSTLYVTLAPCYVCLKLLATAGVKHIYYEYRYESTNDDRDAFWENEIKISKVETFEQLRISEETKSLIVGSLKYPTSRRRLAENKGGKIISLDEDRGGISSPPPSSLDYQMRRELLRILEGKKEAGKIVGKECIAQVPARSSSSSDFNSAASFLASLGVPPSSKAFHEFSDKLLSLLHSNPQGEPALIEGSHYQIGVRFFDGELEVTLCLNSVEFLSNFIPACRAVTYLSGQLVLLAVDRIDIGAREGKMWLVIKQPYVHESQIDQVESLLLGAVF